jgi:hypothetical protein
MDVNHQAPHPPAAPPDELTDAGAGVPTESPAMPVPQHRPTGASLVVLVGVAIAFCGVMLLHAISSDVDPIREVMSHYANGSHGRFMSAVFYALGAAAIAMGVRLRPAVRWRGPTIAVPVLLVLAGLGLIASGVFEVDRPLAPHTLEETIHSNAAVSAFVLMIVSMLLFALAIRDDPRWQSFRWIAVGLAGVAAIAAVGTQFAGDGMGSGAVQRLLAGSVLAWLLLTALHVRTKAFART